MMHVAMLPRHILSCIYCDHRQHDRTDVLHSCLQDCGTHTLSWFILLQCTPLVSCLVSDLCAGQFVAGQRTLRDTIVDIHCLGGMHFLSEGWSAYTHSNATAAVVVSAVMHAVG